MKKEALESWQSDGTQCGIDNEGVDVPRTSENMEYRVDIGITSEWIL